MSKNRWRWSRRRIGRLLTVQFDCRESRHAQRRWWQRIFCYLKRISDAFGTHQCSLLACACAYCAVLSVVPLLAVGIAGLGFFVGSSTQALNDVLNAIRSYVPIQSSLIRDLLQHILQDSGLIGLFGLIGLLYAAHQTFLAMQPAMNIIWSVAETRHWLHQRLVAVMAALYTLALLTADMAISAFLAYLQTRHLPLVPDAYESRVFRFGLGLVPILLITLLFALLYRFLPARAVPWKPAFLGAVVAGVLWQLSKLVFTFSLAYIHSYDRLYGSLSGVVILVVWIYYSMSILLLGAEIAADSEFARHGMQAAEDRAHSGADLAAARGAPPSHTVGTPPEGPPEAQAAEISSE